MAIAVYPTFLQNLLASATGPDLDNAATDVRIALVSAGYTYNAAHDFLDDLGANVEATTPALSSKTVTDGVFDAADPTITDASGDEVVAAVVYLHTGTASTSRLIAYIDEDDVGAPISLLLNGGDVTLTLNSAGIFDLANP